MRFGAPRVHHPTHLPFWAISTVAPAPFRLWAAGILASVRVTPLQNEAASGSRAQGKRGDAASESIGKTGKMDNLLGRVETYGTDSTEIDYYKTRNLTILTRGPHDTPTGVSSGKQAGLEGSQAKRTVNDDVVHGVSCNIFIKFILGSQGSHHQ